MLKQMLLVAGGPLSLTQLRWELQHYSSEVIGVDGGGEALVELDYLPRLLIGDFDSLSAQQLDKFVAAGVEILRYPEKKDETDLELALDWAIEQGATEVKILGGLGGRLDHTMGNVGILVRALKRGVSAMLVDEGQMVCVFDRQMEFPLQAGWALSLIPLPEADGVVTQGLEYPLNRETLRFMDTRGLHNRVINNPGRVELESGILMAIHFKEI